MSASTPTPAGPLVAVVTGASSGLGEATARRLAREPQARLVLVARREERLRALAAELEGTGATVTWVAADLTDDTAPTRVRDHVRAEHGAPTLLVNNAGAGFRARFGSERNGGAANHDKTFALNYFAVLRLTEALLPDLRAAAPSAIVNVASVAAHVARPGAGAYSASKAALAAWSEALRAEEAPYGVHVGTVKPGFFPTEGFPATELKAKRLTRMALGDQDEVAEAIVQCGLGGKDERITPRFYNAAIVLQGVLPQVIRKAVGSDRAQVLATKTVSDE
ncbi:MAG: SDR family NAD(P)-dependent oxidoreductase [Solirubrobacteraceae bacterium]